MRWINCIYVLKHLHCLTENKHHIVPMFYIYHSWKRLQVYSWSGTFVTIKKNTSNVQQIFTYVCSKHQADTSLVNCSLKWRSLMNCSHPCFLGSLTSIKMELGYNRRITEAFFQTRLNRPVEILQRNTLPLFPFHVIITAWKKLVLSFKMLNIHLDVAQLFF